MECGEGSTLPHKYLRVKDKGTKHHYDVLISKFNPEIHEEVTKGPYSGTSSRPRRVQLYVKKPKKSSAKTDESASSAPSGETNTKKED